MEVLYPRCAGVDVHSRRVNACVRVADGRTVTTEHREFATTTAGLLDMAAWLTEAGCTHVAMEATGVYWKPVWHILEDEGSFTLVLANAQHIRNVPGRKSDRKDAAWIADLLAHGLIRGSFVPPAPIQELRDLTRTRKQLVGEITRHTQRLQKTLEDANVKLTRVVTDILGAGGRAILAALIAGETDPERLADCTTGRLKANRADIGDVVADALLAVVGRKRVRQPGQPLARLRVDPRGRQAVGQSLHRRRVRAAQDAGVERVEPDAALRRLPLQVLLPVDAQLRVVREIGAELQEQWPEVVVHHVEVRTPRLVQPPADTAPPPRPRPAIRPSRRIGRRARDWTARPRGLLQPRAETTRTRRRRPVRRHRNPENHNPCTPPEATYPSPPRRDNCLHNLLTPNHNKRKLICFHKVVLRNGQQSQLRF